MQVPYLERYEILQTLGQGGMGVVYLARQKKLDRLVAIKAINPYLAQEPEVRERFTAEASVLARLSHPNIVTLYDYIEEPDALYLVMEYVEGKPLSEILKAGPLPLESVRKYFRQVLDAFAYAHSKGVIHRDIKPSNIIITPEGQVKILDFGVAKILSADHSQTRTGMRLGTLLYMSPEQVKGEKNIDARSDIYSLGVVLFEMLTGKPPYDPELGEFEMSLQIVNQPLFELSHPPAGVPQKILGVILHATEKKPDHRISSCKELQENIEKAFEDSLAPSSPSTEVVAKIPVPSSTQNRKKLWLIVGIGVILILGAISFVFFWNIRSSKVEKVLADTTIREFQSVHSDTGSLTASRGTFQTDSGKPSQESVGSSTQRPPTERASPPSRSQSGDTPQPPKNPKRPPTQKKEAVPPPPASSQDTALKVPTSSPSPPFHKALNAQVQNFKKHGILQVKADLILTNSSDQAWKNINITVRLLSKEGKVKKTDVIQVEQIPPHGRWEKKLDYLVGGTASMEAEVTSAETGP